MSKVWSISLGPKLGERKRVQNNKGSHGCQVVHLSSTHLPKNSSHITLPLKQTSVMDRLRTPQDVLISPPQKSGREHRCCFRILGGFFVEFSTKVEFFFHTVMNFVYLGPTV